jgi:hypothetical protein
MGQTDRRFCVFFREIRLIFISDNRVLHYRMYKDEEMTSTTKDLSNLIDLNSTLLPVSLPDASPPSFVGEIP